jgi:hypothetical protein
LHLACFVPANRLTWLFTGLEANNSIYPRSSFG